LAGTPKVAAMPAATPAEAVGLAANASGLLTSMSMVPVTFAGAGADEQGIAVEVEVVCVQLLAEIG